MSTYQEKSFNDWTDDSLRCITTPSMFAKSTFFYIQEIGHFQTMEHYYTERSNLNSFLIVYTVNGRGKLTYKDKTYTLSPNQLFFIDCMEYQHYITDKRDLWEILWIHFNGSSSRGYYEQFALKNMPVLTLKPDSTIPDILHDLIKVQQRKEIHSELISSKLLVDLMTEILLTIQQLETPNSGIPLYIKNIMKEFDQKFYDNFSLDILASRYAVNKYHLSKEFKRFTGFPPNEYLINNRINQAKELLKYSNFSISEISLMVGIENVSHFINLFKKRTEDTPLVYRKKWQRPN
ncbi:AraC family transcriptional regulator [Vibrio vulnificus]|nr:AraC family transcriptional regulator [Vibrio vulnificus]